MKLHRIRYNKQYGIHQPNRLGLGNLHDSLYVEYCGWEYGLPEKSPPVGEQKTETQDMVKNIKGQGGQSRFGLGED